MNGPRALRSPSVGGAAEADINHVSSMLLTSGATGRFGLRNIPYRGHRWTGDFTPK